MTHTTENETKIYRLAAICAFATALAFIVPRFVPNREGGFASAATAILVFLGLLASAALMSLRLLLLTLRAYHELPLASRIAGIAPSVILVGAVVILLVFLRY
jgi:hypothetical protein